MSEVDETWAKLSTRPGRLSCTFALEHLAMDQFPLILLANEPSSYRSLLATELPFLRPNLRVLEVNPDQLDAAVATYRPSVVICSRALEGADSGFSTLVLCSEEINSFIRSGDRTVVNPRLSDILGEIDRALPPGSPRE